MKITLNLATRPFVELRPLYTRLRAAMVVLAVLATVLGFTLRVVDRQATVSRSQMDALAARTETFRQERAANEARMREPQNAAVLERSRFLNTLFVRKGFSWTAVMMDLEQVLPPGVQVTSIDPQITPEHEVLIRLKVSGERGRAVELVKNLETSKRFVAPRLAGETAQTADANQSGPGGLQRAAAVPSSGVEFDILSGYNPLPAQVRKDREPHTGKQGTEKQGTRTRGAAKPAAGSTIDSRFGPPAGTTTRGPR